MAPSVTARYVFGAPLIWSDEVLSVVSGWFIMFAATGAFVGERHLKLTGLFGKERSAGQRRLAMLAEGATVILVGSLILPSIQTAVDQWDTRTAILSIPPIGPIDKPRGRLRCDVPDWRRPLRRAVPMAIDARAHCGVRGGCGRR